MAYGIEDLIRAGVPAAIFPRHEQYYQVGNGKLHLDRQCPPRGYTVTAIYADPVSTRDKQLCSRCGTNPGVRYGLWEAVDAGRMLHDVAAHSAAEDPNNLNWVTVARTRELLTRTHRLTESHNVALGAAVRAAQDTMHALIAAARSHWTVDVDAWCDAAVVPEAVMGRRDLPGELVARLAALNLPSYWPCGPRDGAWLYGVLEQALLGALLAGNGWTTATAAAHAAVTTEITARHAVATAELTAVLDDLLDLWRDRVDEARAAFGVEGGTREVVLIATRARSSAEGRVTTRYWDLLAPALHVAEADGGDQLAARVPEAVAIALAESCASSIEDTALVRVAGNADGEDLEVLTLLLKLLVENPNLSPADGLTAARGVLTPA